MTADGYTGVPAGSGAVDSVAGKTGNVTLVATDISDSTTVGRSVLTAASQAAGRTAIGAGTSSLTIGTSSSTAAAGDVPGLHVAASDPHTQYALESALGDAAGKNVGTGSTNVAAGDAVATHVAAADPHTQYTVIMYDTAGVYGTATDAKIYVGATTPASPVNGDVWIHA